MWPLFNKSYLAPHLTLGKTGERIAEKFLKRQGYTILDKNVRVGKRDEIDLIAFDPSDEVIVFIEVKSRAVYNDEYPPERSFSWKKRRSVQRASRKWMAWREYDAGFRMDLVCVAGGKVVRHVEDVEWVR